MARYTGPRFKLSRRLGISLSGTGKELKRPYPPGQHGPGQRRKLSGYGMQLQEKQKLRHMYGLSEKQFRNLFDKAVKMKGIAGENFMFLLESRLDNLVYRLGFANSRAGARQLVAHGHVTVNGKKVDIPSYLVQPGDVIEVIRRECDRIKPDLLVVGTRGRAGIENDFHKSIAESLLRGPPCDIAAVAADLARG